jgi:hypothetical protein
VRLGFELRASCLQSKQVIYLESYFKSILLWLFWRWGLRAICLAWPENVILLISASEVARITGVRQPAPGYDYIVKKKIQNPKCSKIGNFLSADMMLEKF